MINVLMAANDRVYSGLELCIYTLLYHNKGVNIHIFTMDIDIERNGEGMHYLGLQEDHKKRLEKIVRYLDPTSHIVFDDVKDLYMKHLYGNPNEWSGFTPYTQLRLLSDLALPYLDHVLYLDCDVVVQGDITQMYYEYLKKDHTHYAYFCDDACGYEGEMVAGIMLMDLGKMRETNFLEKARKNIHAHEYRYPDQDAIRDTGVKAIPLPETYSYMEPLEKCHYTPVMLHFTNKLSPKIYTAESTEVFYRRYPQFKYVQDGLKLLDTLDI